MRQAAALLLVCAACGPVVSPAPTPTLPAAAPTVPLLRSDPEAFCPPPRAWVGYRVQPGDTIPELAQATDAEVTTLLTANCLRRLGPLTPGSVFYLPRQP